MSRAWGGIYIDWCITTSRDVGGGGARQECVLIGGQGPGKGIVGGLGRGGVGVGRVSYKTSKD